MRFYQGTKEAWNAFVAANAEDGGVLQSWEWGEMEEKEGHKKWRLAWYDGDALVAACLLVERTLSPLLAGPRQRRWPLGFRYLYAPRGPVIKISNFKFQISNVIAELVAFAREHGVAFLRIEPPHENVKCQMSNVKCFPVVAVQPQHTLRIDLTKSEEELLSSMHQKTRYNIRLAEKHGVRVENSKSEILNPKQIQNSKFETFYSLLEETAKRDGFALHTEEHYKNLLELPYCSLLTAYYKQIPLATAIVAFFGTTAYYLHGASTSAHREVMAPYALHWEIIREAKRRGCTVYDVWGVDEKKWPGVTRFKRGFAPAAPVTTYAGTVDIPVRRVLYSMYRVWKSFR